MPRNTVKAGLTPYRTKGGEPFTGGRAQFYIDNTYATALGEGDPVKIADGYVTKATDTDDGVAGVFAGCKYIDPVTKQPIESSYYPGGITSGGMLEGQADILAYVYVADDLTFLAKSDAAMAASTAGQTHPVVYGTPSAVTKRSAALIDADAQTDPELGVLVQIRSFPNIAGTKPGDNPTVVEVTLVTPKIV
jgi:hypothetical protein